MSKSVSILIPNYNSFEAIQLCIESIRRYTLYPHKIIVSDDICKNGIDDIYLAECERKGWIELYSSRKQRTHGGNLNFLINEKCDADYAMIMDCDVYIKDSGWLRDLVTEIEKDPKTFAVVGFHSGGLSPVGYQAPFYTFWFGLINMAIYQDGMQIDWMFRDKDRREEPFRQEFQDMYPPEKHKEFPIFNSEQFDENTVHMDPGSWPYFKIKYDNPKGYIVVPVPEQVRQKFHHWGHVSMIGIQYPFHSEATRQKRKALFEGINRELRKLREE